MWDVLLPPKWATATLTAAFYSFLYNLCHKRLCLLLAKKCCLCSAASCLSFSMPLGASCSLLMLFHDQHKGFLLCSSSHTQLFSVTNSLLRTWRLEIWVGTRLKLQVTPTCYTFLFSLYKKPLSTQLAKPFCKWMQFPMTVLQAFLSALGKPDHGLLAVFCNTCESVYFIFWSHTTHWYPSEFNLFGEY